MSRLAAPDVSKLTSVKVDGVSPEPNEVVETKEELREKFAKYGEVGDVYIPRDRNFAFVRFADRKDAEDSVTGMDGARIMGKVISVTLSQQQKKSAEEYAEMDRQRGGGGGRGGSADSRSRSRRRRRDASGGRRRRRDRDDSRDDRRRRR
eukprot:TRINITY_DN112479_c0_g1_i1.p1 TRINITY_DN112479_c0_g1~~TRINITY_DN112479_c0_g1_i1.p1  ORF type:complete len:150 (+),score=28.74 TRINITY_DN112479_c0_g1_i1:143-592(+)